MSAHSHVMFYAQTYPPILGRVQTSEFSHETIEDGNCFALHNRKVVRHKRRISNCCLKGKRKKKNNTNPILEPVMDKVLCKFEDKTL